MKLVEIVFSPTGGTKKVCDIIAGEFEGEEVSIDLMKRESLIQPYDINVDDLCFIAVPSFGGRVPTVAIERLEQIKGNQAKAILIVSYGNRAYDDTLLELKNTAENCGFQCIAAIAAVTEHSIMRQFGTGRPDEKDQKELKGYTAHIVKKLNENSELKMFQVPGNQQYLKYTGVPFTPKANKSCTECGICASVCPTDAISKHNPKLTDKKKCITCMACVTACPQHARGLNKFLMTVATSQMKKVCSTRKQNDFFE